MDLAVVGSGIIGSFVAHEARRLRPDWEILVLDKGAVAGGATTWSAGASFPIAPTSDHRELHRVSAERFAGLAGTRNEAFLRTVPMVYVLRQDRIAAFQDRVVAPLRALEPSGQDRIREYLPDLVIGADERFLTHDGEGFAVWARPLADSLLVDLIADGHLRVETGQHIGRVVREDGDYLLEAEDVTWRSRRVVLATGPWQPPTDLLPGVDAPARVKRVAALHADLPVRVGDPLVYFVDDDLFLLPLAAGSALVSFRSEVWDAVPDTLDGRLDDGDLRDGRAALAARSHVAAASVTGGRAFCDLYTPDRLPLVHADPALPGLAAVMGGSGSGVRLAPALAARAVRAVMG
ncbi:NAD(P)/FAD-dependent oxidoreductase [Kitasatospora aureofaciens]|uniref:NAD(P)/FAD-dependent oxidoreductase n=1 Tax=Kitasatospora aureofaciens TaxID=1894 RepID=UPI0037C8348A